jgi:hypothetical protein
MENLVIVHRNPDPEGEQCIAPLWRIDRQNGSSQFWDRGEIEENDRRRHPRDGAIEKIVTATYRILEHTRG